MQPWPLLLPLDVESLLLQASHGGLLGKLLSWSRGQSGLSSSGGEEGAEVTSPGGKRTERHASRAHLPPIQRSEEALVPVVSSGTRAAPEQRQEHLEDASPPGSILLGIHSIFEQCVLGPDGVLVATRVDVQVGPRSAAQQEAEAMGATRPQQQEERGPAGLQGTTEFEAALAAEAPASAGTEQFPPAAQEQEAQHVSLPPEERAPEIAQQRASPTRRHGEAVEADVPEGTPLQQQQQQQWLVPVVHLLAAPQEPEPLAALRSEAPALPLFDSFDQPADLFSSPATGRPARYTHVAPASMPRAGKHADRPNVIALESKQSKNTRAGSAIGVPSPPLHLAAVEPLVPLTAAVSPVEVAEEIEPLGSKEASPQPAEECDAAHQGPAGGTPWAAAAPAPGGAGRFESGIVARRLLPFLTSPAMDAMDPELETSPRLADAGPATLEDKAEEEMQPPAATAAGPVTAPTDRAQWPSSERKRRRVQRHAPEESYVAAAAAAAVQPEVQPRSPKRPRGQADGIGVSLWERVFLQELPQIGLAVLEQMADSYGLPTRRTKQAK